MPSGIPSITGRAAVAGALQGLSIGPVDWVGKASFGRVLQTGLSRDDTDGFPAPPSLRFEWWGFWRFRWAVDIGTMSLTLYAKQALNESPRPSIVLKADSAVGLLVDTPFSAGAGSGWEAVTATFIATAAGVIWVELWNNLNTHTSAPCLWSGAGFDKWLNGVPVLDGGTAGAAPVTGFTTHLVSARQQRTRSP